METHLHQTLPMSDREEKTDTGDFREAARHLRRFCWLKPKELSGLLKETVVEWSDDNVPRLGASLAFYTLLSLAPLLVVVVAIAAIAYGKQAAQGELFGQISGLVGPQGARAIQGLLEGAYKPGTGLLATILGLLTLAVGASSVVVELRSALNTIWHVPATSDGMGLSSVLQLLKERFYSFGLVLGVGFLLLVSLVLNTFLAAFGKFFGSILPAPEWLLQAATSLISFLVITGLFAMIYKLVPDVRLKWSDVIVGSSVTALLFSVGKHLIGLYLGKASFGSTYGAAGSLVVVLVWVYYSSQLFFLGAEFTKIYTQKFGSQLTDKLGLNPPMPASAIVSPADDAQPTNERGHVIQ
jgi:membrane protein